MATPPLAAHTAVDCCTVVLVVIAAILADVDIMPDRYSFGSSRILGRSRSLARCRTSRGARSHGRTR